MLVCLVAFSSDPNNFSKEISLVYIKDTCDDCKNENSSSI